MSRVSLIEQLYAPKRKSALEFNYDALWAPPIRFFLSQQDINELYKIATSLKYNDNIEKKYELIDAIMRPRGFKRGNCGTNRVVYNFLEDTSFCMKIALDRVGINDSPREYKNQEFFKPFCCKIFEVDPTGVIACVERVNPISSLEEFASIADDVFNMMVTKIIGKYVVDDLGTEKFMNYGIRYNSNGVAFGPVVLDYPYAYELDGAKLHCAKPIQIGNKEFACGGEIDYDAGLNNLVCCKCGRHYSARELAKDDSNVLKFYSDDDQCRMRARIVRETDGTIIKDSGRSSKVYMTKEEYEEGTKLFEVKDFGPRNVEKTIKKPYTPMKKLREQYHTELQTKAFEEMQKRNAEPFNPVIESELGPRPAKRAPKVNENSVDSGNAFNFKEYSNDYAIGKGIEWDTTVSEDEIPRVRPARRAEDLDDSKIEVIKTDKLDEIKTVIEEIKNSDEPTEDIAVDSIPQEETVTEDCDLNTAILEAVVEATNDKSLYESEELQVSDTENEEYDLPDEVENNDFSDNDKFVYVNGNYCMGVDESDCEPPEYYYEDDNAESFSEEMEADVFPEIMNQGIETISQSPDTVCESPETISQGIDIASQSIDIEASLEVDIDYSNYEPPEEDNDIVDNYHEDDGSSYSDYYKTDRKEKKRDNKKQQNIRTKKYDAGDMSDY